MNTTRKPASQPAEPPAADPAVEALRAELEGLVRIAARRPQLTLRTGRPGGSWSFNWSTDEVTVDPGHLRSLAPDLCRGLALHEATHAAVTVLHRVVPTADLTRLHPLLNTLEDIRIEVWMRARFPGAAAWIRAYNDVFYTTDPGAQHPRSRQVQFLHGILDRWWFGITRAGTLPEVNAALEACHEAIAAATACQPPLDDDRAAVIASQRAMWDIVRRRILPAWERLVTLDRRDGLARIASTELAAFCERTGHGGGRDRRRRPANPQLRTRGIRRGGSRSGGGTSAGPDRALAAPARDGGHDAYDDAWRRVAAVADRLGDELLRVLVPRRRMRWSAGHPWGPRLDLRRAMQFEANPLLHDSLWQRPILPRRCDPSVILLVDRSASMVEGGRIDRALEGTVLLTEVCRRIGVAVAVCSFANDFTVDLDWDADIASARRRLGLLPDRCAGCTAMAAAIRSVGRLFAAHHGDPKLLFAISDGDPDDHSATLAAVRSLDAAGIASIGLGLGPDTAQLAEYFETAVTEIAAPRLVDHVADLLGAALMGTPS